MKFSPKCRTRKLGKICTSLGSFCSFLNWEGADIRSQIRLRKIPDSLLIIILRGHTCYNFQLKVPNIQRVKHIVCITTLFQKEL